VVVLTREKKRGAKKRQQVASRREISEFGGVRSELQG
jgi:hypothetical protein